MLALMPTDAPDDAAATRRRAPWAGLALSLAVLLIALPVIASGRAGPSEASDQDKYHLPVIDAMVNQWPAIDIVNFDSATAPGYHALMAGVRVLLGEDAGPMGVRVLNALFGALVPLCAFLVARRWTTPARAALLTAPLAFNPYILGGAMYLTTDNLAYILVLSALGLSLGSLTPGRAARAGLCATLAVAVRQIHVWTIAPLAVAAFLASPLGKGAGKGSWRSAVIAVLGVLAAGGLLVLFYALWGGLTPPSDAAIKHAGGPNPASPALALALCGVSAPLLGAGALLASWQKGVRRWWVIGGIVGLLVGAAPETSYQLKRRAYGWMWRLVEEAPVVADRSLLIVLLATLGGGAIAALGARCVRRGRGAELLVLAVGASGWLAAQSMNTMAWQRYFEPLLLALVAWLVVLAGACDVRTRLQKQLACAGPALLAIVQLALSALTLGREVLAAPPVNF